MLAGNLSLKLERPKLWDALRRVQIDVRRGHKNIIEALQLIPDKETVLEANQPNSILVGAQLNTHPLLPKEHLFAFPGYCGYSIIDGEVELVLGRHDMFWISVEGFRNENGITMDLMKVEEVLDLTEDHVTNDSWVKALLQTGAIQKRFSEHP